MTTPTTDELIRYIERHVLDDDERGNVEDPRFTFDPAITLAGEEITCDCVWLFYTVRSPYGAVSARKKMFYMTGLGEFTDIVRYGS